MIHKIFAVDFQSIDYKRLPITFILSDSPVPERLNVYADFFIKCNAALIVRLCDSNYDLSSLESSINTKYSMMNYGFRCISNDELHFRDGGVPSIEILRLWIGLIGKVLDVQQESKQSLSVVVHCLSGLGRAPVFIAVAILVYTPSSDVLDVIQYIRKFRKGAFNQAQISWLADQFDKKIRKKLYTEISPTSKKSFLGKLKSLISKE